MPEEKNRVHTDKLSTLLFSPTQKGIDNLIDEGFPQDNIPPYSAENPTIYHCGDVMYDNAVYFAEISDRKSDILNELGNPKDFFLATVHRNYNTDDPKRLGDIFESFIELANNGHHLVIPLHPRTKKALESLSDNLRDRIEKCDGVQIVPPVSYLDIIALEKNARLIITDSGGMQKEAFFYKKPCVILREETEWTELVENGNARLCGADKDLIINAVNSLLSGNEMTFPPFYGDGKAAEFICKEIATHL